MTTIIFRTAESFIKPERTEEVSNGYYIRRNYRTEQVQDQQDETITKTKYIYDEAFLTNSQYQAYTIGLMIANEDTSDAYLRYKQALDTGVVFDKEKGGNGLLYKPKWVKEANGDKGIYFALLEDWERLGGESVIKSLPLWDATELPENVREFDMAQFKALIGFLAMEQEKLFGVYKTGKGEEI